MFKISHEVPVALFEESLKFNDYDYCLVHLWENNPRYRQFYLDCLQKGRTVILDNSAYELGEPYNEKLYADAVLQLQPTEYILPDYRNDAKRNLDAIKNWKLTSPSRKIGVVHGENFEAYCQNYKDIEPYVDKIAFSVEDFFFGEFSRNIPAEEARIRILAIMLVKKIINKDKPHHILGALSPTEYQAYTKYDWIETADTSNPVLHGLLGMGYQGKKGLESKSPIKLDSLIDEPIDINKKEIIKYNIWWFRNQFIDKKEMDEVEGLLNEGSKIDPGFREITESLTDLLEYKNEKYGNSALEPIEVFNGKSKVGQRADDKISRIKNNPKLQKNDIADLIGYLVLICRENGWSNFDEFKD